MPSVTQNWVQNLSFMQQSVLLAAVRGPDGQAKYNPPKMLLRYYRRCILISALDGDVLTHPADQRGGSFTGPSLDVRHYSVEDTNTYKMWVAMDDLVTEYIRHLDAIPSHFSNHFRDAMQIVGYKHPDEVVRRFWNKAYLRQARELNLCGESEEQMDIRLGDNREQWLKTADVATVQ